MKNVLKYYYDLEPETIHQLNCNYRCRVNGIDYCLQKVDTIGTDFDNLYALDIYLLKNGFFCHQIVLNLKNDIITFVNNVPYVLLKIFVLNREANIKDIKFFSKLYVEHLNYGSLDKSDWYNLWSKKIDYIEYQISQFGKKYPIIRKSINYYIGLAENSISLLSTVSIKKNYLVVSHRRIGDKNKIYDLYNPINFILDTRVRDLSEFYKDNFFSGNFSFERLKADVLEYKLTSDEATLFLARMLFPTYYFDCYQEILLGSRDEKDLLNFINKASEYQLFLSKLYFFLREYHDVPEIEWIIKTQTSSLR